MEIKLDIDNCKRDKFKQILDKYYLDINTFSNIIINKVIKDQSISFIYDNILNSKKEDNDNHKSISFGQYMRKEELPNGLLTIKYAKENGEDKYIVLIWNKKLNKITFHYQLKSKIDEFIKIYGNNYPIVENSDIKQEVKAFQKYVSKDAFVKACEIEYRRIRSSKSLNQKIIMKKLRELINLSK